MLGREGYDGWWCMWCWLMKPGWRQGVCKHDQPLYKSCTEDGCTHHQGLDIQEIIHQYNDNVANNRYDKASTTARKGVAMMPLLNKGTIVVAPGLHYMMGIAEILIGYHFDMIDEHVEPLKPHELATRESISKNDAILDEEKTRLKVWDDAVNGGMELEAKSKESKQLETKIKSGNAQPGDEEKKKDVDERIKALEMVRDGHEKKIARLKKEIKDAKAKWEAIRSNNKLDSNSIYNKCEDILKKYGIYRSAYHGGKFTGVDIIKMMDDATKIYSEMEQVMLTEGRYKNGTEKEKKIIKDFCEEVKSGLQLWNEIFARVSNQEAVMDDKYCDETQELINVAMKFMRRLKFSITPKLHGMECHIVHQMRTIKGFAYMLEQFIEHYHQIGHRMDVQWQGQSFSHQADLRSRKEHILQLPESKIAARKLKECYGVKKRKRDEAVVENEKRIKKEREGGVDAVLAILARPIEVVDVEMEEVAEEEVQDVEMLAEEAETEVQDGADTGVVDDVIVEDGAETEIVDDAEEDTSRRGRSRTKKKRFECEG